MKPVALSKPEIVWPARAVLGEGPVWDPRGQALYWVDIKGLKLHRYTPGPGKRETWTADEPIGCIDAPNSRGELLAATRSGFAWLTLGADGAVRRKLIASPEADALPGNRFNDGTRAPDGSFWAGTMDDAEDADTGAWWRLDPDSGEVDKIDDGYRVTNGPAFDTRNRRVYLTDSARQTIFKVPFDSVCGARIADKTVFLQFAPSDGFPDGMEVFPDGSLCVAFWDGGCLRRFSPEGQLLQVIDLPVRRPTSLALAREAEAIFVTSASTGLPSDGVQGGLLQLRLDTSPSTSGGW